MKLFLCHTPLHLLISMMVVCEESDPQNTVFVVVEDSLGLHDLASRLLDESRGRVVLLPGMATAKGGIQRTLIMRSNVNFLCKTWASVVSVFYFFHDLRPEPQALLNLKRLKRISAKFIMLEDGIALYEPGGFIDWNFIGVLKHKIAAGRHWVKFDQLGLHPNITKIRCFYPELLRPNLRALPAVILPRSRISIENTKLQLPLDLFGKKIALVAVPFVDFVSVKFMMRFLETAMDYCSEHDIFPFFKLHPRDRNGTELLKSLVAEPRFFPQHLPAEMIFFSELDIHSFIGSRTSSLHIAKFLFPQMNVLHYDEASDEEGKAWTDFLDHVGVPLITRNTGA